MKNMQLNKLVKRSDKYFKKLGVVTPEGKNKKTIEYIVRRSYEALPKRLKEFIENPERNIKVLTNTIIQAGRGGELKPYQAFVELAKNKQRSSYYGTKRDIFREFRVQEPALYAKYNSYMFRRGYSSTKYWFDNVGITLDGKIARTICELPSLDLKPKKTAGRPRGFYSALEIQYDLSTGRITAYMY
jgi:hypothetical protein